MKKQDLNKKSTAELTKHVADLREKLADMKRNKYLSDERNNSKARTMRKEIARALTRINGEVPAKVAEEPKKTKESK